VTALLGPLVSAVFAGLIVAAGYTGSSLLLAAAVALPALVLALGWPRLLDLPALPGSLAVIALTGLAGAATAVAAAGMTRPLAPFAALLAGAVVVAFAHELLRRHGRPHLVESVTGTLCGQTLVLLGGGWVLVPGTRFGLITLAGARLTVAVPVPERFAGWASLVVGVLAGALVGLLIEPRRAAAMLAVALVVSAVAAGLDRLLIPLAAGRSALRRLAAAAAPVLAVGTVAYAVARLVP
jgi:hypothetical protein